MSASVDFLADAWRHQGSPFADAVLAGRFMDYTLAERRAAIEQVIVEKQAALVVLEEHRRVLYERAFEVLLEGLDDPESDGR